MKTSFCHCCNNSRNFGTFYPEAYDEPPPPLSCYESGGMEKGDDVDNYKDRGEVGGGLQREAMEKTVKLS